MKHINKTARKVLDHLVELAKETGHYKLDRGGAAIMAVVVERVGECDWGKLYSVAHYYEQNGDLMADPEMVFIQAHDGNYYPISFSQASLAIYQESIVIEGFKVVGVRAKQQKDHAVFAGQWMKNIGQQQEVA